MTFELYRHFFSHDFSKIRSEARKFRNYKTRSPIPIAHYFIYIDLGIIDDSDRVEYYDTITQYAAILYFFSGLVEHLKAGTINKNNMRRLFGHVFEWWYLHSIKEFMPEYKEAYKIAQERRTNTVDDRIMLSEPPWVKNISMLEKNYAEIIMNESASRDYATSAHHLIVTQIFSNRQDHRLVG